MSAEQSVIADWLWERGYTRRQVARALVALGLPEDGEYLTEARYIDSRNLVGTMKKPIAMGFEAAYLEAEALRVGLLSAAESGIGTPPAPAPTHGPSAEVGSGRGDVPDGAAER